MAKKSMIARDVKRAKLVDKFAEKRAELKARIKAGDVEAVAELNKLPKNASPVRKRNRCQIDGRPRGYMREFGISRIKFRQLAGAGLIPGVTKSSW
ncbi:MULTISPECIES: 30S ribosomal protein S14 [Psychrilyobacter]|jgi:small subunit ribosomal protein S14|uniref:Small ribosomal subunit protein uS14 n=1 Tax=Psychrilyobacter piezotolerans TaxID=2293438 RepID=A0ABX9KH02_9FUSO|nr:MULTISPECIES: 30S ribosomal protein S14 [Psychrilyobacter]MCS5422697.1 30S ribosomal protein S14 [Psychrilyobacter sp. S5]NDI77885.1 30S ribosomal protein S14 [Psychrilyobacter piezotolerans]RDE62003.1 30S ribosomal protein S14 [Psychrilyobacter sp. S5]REI41250.1 30S ribosomal protein S14 [Psychrilyobacter piezotolerans]